MTKHEETATLSGVGSTDGLADVVWRLNDIREMLLTQRIVGYGSLYGLDEWSTPIKNLDTAIEKLKRLAANAVLTGAGQETTGNGAPSHRVRLKT